MSKREKAKRRDRIELAVVIFIFVILLLIIGFLLYRIMRGNVSAPGILSAPETVTETTPEPAPAIVPAPTAAPEVTPEPEAEPTPEPTPEPEAEPTPEPTPEPVENFELATSKVITITKHPGGESIHAGNNVVFVAHATNAVSVEWRLVSPEYDREVVWNAREIGTEFPGIKCTDGDKDTFIIYGAPKELDGWSAVCLFTDKDGGKLASDGAKIRVSAP